MASNPTKFKAGDRVLAKAAPFVPWPSYIVPYSLIPEKVARFGRSKKSAGKPYCVIYIDYGDTPNYSWVAAKDLSILTQEAADAFLNSKPKDKKDPDLVTSYKGVSKYTSCEDYLRKINVIGEDDEYDENESFNPAYEAKQAAAEAKKAGKREAESDDKPDTAKKQKRGKSPSASPEDVVLTPDDIQKRAQIFRHKLQRGLIQRTEDPSVEEMEEAANTFDELEKFASNIDIAALRFSKLHKVLKAIAKTPSLERPDDFQFHARSDHLLLKWESIIYALRAEKDKEKSRLDTPNSSILDHNDAPKSEPDSNGNEKNVKPSNGSDFKTETSNEQVNERVINDETITKEADGEVETNGDSEVKHETEEDSKVKEDEPNEA